MTKIAMQFISFRRLPASPIWLRRIYKKTCGYKAIIFAIAIIIGFAGCVTVPPVSQPLPKAIQKAKLQKLRNWQFNGALSISQGNSGAIVNVNWHQHTDDYTIALTSILDIAGAQIVGNKHQITLIRAGQPPVTAATPEKLMQKELGWWLPLENTHYWLFALPSPNIPYKATYYANTSLQLLQQQHWQIHYVDYQVVDGIYLPHLVVFEYPSLRLKLVIKKWSLQ
jgi:outer membrane lipoprotein LolB